MSMNERAGASTYVLGHADTEIQRLLLQGRLYNDLTEHALRLAGLRPGMRVLDVGCGLGDVSFVAARLVGPAGTVLGVDASSDVVEFARARAAERGLTTVKFEQTTIADIAVDEVDACRVRPPRRADRVLRVRHRGRAQRPGLTAVAGAGGRHRARLPRCGPRSSVRSSTAYIVSRSRVTRATADRRCARGYPEVWVYAVEVWRLFPIAEQLGLVTDELADIDTLLPRMLEQAAAADAIVILPPMITAWTPVCAN